MQFPVEISIPVLWGQNTFKKDQWGALNFLVGPNGTGKSKFIDELKVKFQSNSNLKVRYISTDRIVGWTKQSSSTYMNSQLNAGINLDWVTDFTQHSKVRGETYDAFTLLKNDLTTRIKVESVLSQLLNRNIILNEVGGFLKPEVSKDNSSYSFKEAESHGLKEIITLLAVLHDNSSNCVIIDEPELHLHPQYQTYFLQEVRKMAGDPLTDPTKKCFFFATHSPHFLDFRTIDELKHCIFFQPDKLPTYISSVEKEDEYKLNQLLPRLNTHHKQFFFSTRPVFVEGYTDQQIFSLIQEKRGKLLGIAGTTFIDVNGKDELDLYLRLCRQLSINCQAITDLDTLIAGKLRESISEDQRCMTYLQEKGISTELQKGWSELAQNIDLCINELISIYNTITNPSLTLKQLHDAISNESENKNKRYLFLLGILKIKTELKEKLPTKDASIEFVFGRTRELIEAFSKSGVFVLQKGELEHYLIDDSINPFMITEKIKNTSFVKERDYLLSTQINEDELLKKYDGLISILDSATQGKTIDYVSAVLQHLVKFIFDVQSAYRFGEIKDLDGLKKNKKIDYEKYQRLIEITNFQPNDNKFQCKFRLKEFTEINKNELIFDNNTNISQFRIKQEPA